MLLCFKYTRATVTCIILLIIIYFSEIKAKCMSNFILEKEEDSIRIGLVQNEDTISPLNHISIIE